MAIVRWSPMQELEAMERRMRRMFEEPGWAASPLPAADVFETDTEFVVEVEAPGYSEGDLKIEVDDSTVVITGERSETKEEKEKTFHRKERLEASFERRFSLPPAVDPAKVSASFAKGVLTVRAAKAKEAKPRKISIKAG